MKDSKILVNGQKLVYRLNGLHCAACELVVEKKLTTISNIKNVNAILEKESVQFEIADNIEEKILMDKINRLLAENGYSIKTNTNAKVVEYSKLVKGFAYAVLVILFFLLLQKIGLGALLGGEALSLPLVFFIGVVASLSSCMAVVGGLVFSISSSYAKGGNRTIPLIMFHVSRVVTFFLLGGLLGYLGSLVRFGPEFYLTTSIILFIVMFVLGMNLLDMFPVFRRFQLRMPKIIGRKVSGFGMIHQGYIPILMGVVTFFLPCGFTQSMQISAMTTGSLLGGAMIMLVFALGTLPVLGVISFTSTILASGRNSEIFFKSAGFIVLFFALYNFYTSLVAAGIITTIF